MRKKNKRVAEAFNCLAEAESTSGVVRNVRVLGVKSKNGREYPVEVMQRALPMYDGAVVHLDHPSHDRPRSVKDVFGRIRNPRIERDGIVADLEYNASHEYAPAFEWFAANQPESVGLSHEAIAKTKMDYKTGIEVVEDIVDLEAVSLVANPATNPKGLFESYQRIMESQMAKSKKEPEAMPAHEEKLSGHGDCPPGMAAEVTLVEPGKHVSVPEEEYGTFEEFRSAMKEKVRACMSEEMDPEEKLEKIISTLVPNDLHEEMDGHADKKDEMDDAQMAKESEDDDADDKVKAEESIRKSSKVGYKLLLEELDAYRQRDAHAALLSRVNDFCRKSGMSDRLVTEAFVDALASVDESKWAKLVEDRKAIAASKSPMSFAGETVANKTALTVDGLMKALRS